MFLLHFWISKRPRIKRILRHTFNSLIPSVLNLWQKVATCTVSIKVTETETPKASSEKQNRGHLFFILTQLEHVGKRRTLSFPSESEAEHQSKTNVSA